MAEIQAGTGFSSHEEEEDALWHHQLADASKMLSHKRLCCMRW